MTLRTRWTNWKAKVRLRELRKEHGHIEKKAKEMHNEGLLDDWEAEHAWEFESTNAQIKENLSTDVLNQARELYLPTPSLNDNTKWMPEDDFTHTGPRWWILTPEAMIELNGAIRREKQARREVVEWWIKVLGGFVAILTGLLGAGIGLVAVWKK